MEKFWHRAIYSQLRCEPEEHRFILTEPPLNTPENREQMAEIMFETFNVKGLFIGVQATLALYAQISGPESKSMANGDLTGTVIDSGDGVTHTAPIYEGFSIPHAVAKIQIAGRDLTQFMQKLLLERSIKLTSSAELEIVRDIKEKLCFVA
jgi:actin-related protein